VAYFVFRFRRVGKADANSFLLLQNQLGELTNRLDDKLGRSNTEMQEAVRHQFSVSQELIKNITNEIATVRESSKQVVGVADQLRSLQNVLQNPKQRGVLGEYYLESVLQNILAPGLFEIQYKFADGEIVDAVIKIKDKLVPVDSKFSLENYNRWVSESHGPERDRLEKLFMADLKNRIVETAKYIRPSEGTMDFAFMFMPSEGTYYDLMVNKIGSNEEENLLQRAVSKYNVIIVSPTSLLAYLQTVLQGLRALQIEDSAKEIRRGVIELGKHLAEYEKDYRKMGNSLKTTVSHYNSSYKQLGMVDKDVLRITGEPIGISKDVADPPQLPE